jgi:hypothetical protein
MATGSSMEITVAPMVSVAEETTKAPTAVGPWLDIAKRL